MPSNRPVNRSNDNKNRKRKRKSEDVDDSFQTRLNKIGMLERELKDLTNQVLHGLQIGPDFFSSAGMQNVMSNVTLDELMKRRINLNNLSGVLNEEDEDDDQPLAENEELEDLVAEKKNASIRKRKFTAPKKSHFCKIMKNRKQKLSKSFSKKPGGPTTKIVNQENAGHILKGNENSNLDQDNAQHFKKPNHFGVATAPRRIFSIKQMKENGSKQLNFSNRKEKWQNVSPILSQKSTRFNTAWGFDPNSSIVDKINEIITGSALRIKQPPNENADGHCNPDRKRIKLSTDGIDHAINFRERDPDNYDHELPPYEIPTKGNKMEMDFKQQKNLISAPVPIPADQNGSSEIKTTITGLCQQLVRQLGRDFFVSEMKQIINNVIQENVSEKNVNMNRCESNKPRPDQSIFEEKKENHAQSLTTISEDLETSEIRIRSISTINASGPTQSKFTVKNETHGSQIAVLCFPDSSTGSSASTTALQDPNVYNDFIEMIKRQFENQVTNSVENTGTNIHPILDSAYGETHLQILPTGAPSAKGTRKPERNVDDRVLEKCPHCFKEMLVKSMEGHMRNSCKKLKFKANLSNYHWQQ